jgi:hypothetical protein
MSGAGDGGGIGLPLIVLAVGMLATILYMTMGDVVTRATLSR